MKDSLSSSLVDLLNSNLNGNVHISRTGLNSDVSLLDSGAKTGTVCLVALVVSSVYQYTFLSGLYIGHDDTSLKKLAHKSALMIKAFNILTQIAEKCNIFLSFNFYFFFIYIKEAENGLKKEKIMYIKKLFNALPVAAALLITALTLSYTAFAAITEPMGDKAAGGSLGTVGAKPLKYEFSSHSPSVLESQTSKPSTDSSVQVSASKSDAVGKIYEQFLSPYAAKYSYNGIYLKNNTGLSVDIKNELSAGLRLKLNKSDEPQVLIVHTHATESYMAEERDFYTAADKPRSTDNEKNVTEIGEIIAEKLRAGGIGVIHDRTQHDHPSYNGSYNRSAKTINEYLKKYPSIKIVVDVHRDSIAMTGKDKCKPTAEIGGKKAAQVMLVMGSETGSVSGFPNWRQNFRLALRFQQTMEAMYPGLARPMVLCSARYNENLTEGSMLLEVGTDSNTFEEAKYSAELAGDALCSLLNTLK